MTKTHNKKRNVGIIYEQLVNFTCNKLVSNKLDESKKIFNIINKRFKKGTQLNKELRLFNALVRTKNVEPSFATSIMTEAKNACKDHFDKFQLDKEKTDLIRELNYEFGKGIIFDQKISNYKDYATIQTLLNEWRSLDRSNIDIIAKYESILHKSMTEKELIKEEKEEEDSVDALTVKLMNEKFNKKYSNLNDDQAKLVQEFVLMNSEESKSNFSSLLKEVKQKSINSIKEYNSSCNNRILNEKYDIVLENIKSLKEEDHSEDNLKKFLVVAQLNKEILEKE